jgi:hypothetical protein
MLLLRNIFGTRLIIPLGCFFPCEDNVYRGCSIPISVCTSSVFRRRRTATANGGGRGRRSQQTNKQTDQTWSIAGLGDIDLAMSRGPRHSDMARVPV